jgi:hypothetical protein
MEENRTTPILSDFSTPTVQATMAITPDSSTPSATEILVGEKQPNPNKWETLKDNENVTLGTPGNCIRSRYYKPLFSLL